MKSSKIQNSMELKMSKLNIVSFSSGKDSSAMLLRMIELNMPIDRIIFCDTKLEFPEMYKWIKEVSKKINKKIEFISGESWDKWFYGKWTRGKHLGEIRGFPFVISKNWCMRELKHKPMEKIFNSGDIIYLGIAYNEKQRIQKNNLKYKYPLIEWKWTEQDCLDYLKRRGLKYPLLKFKRTGCWLCPKQNLQSLKILMNDYPDLWKKLKQYEKDSPHGFKPNFSLKDFELKQNS